MDVVNNVNLNTLDLHRRCLRNAARPGGTVVITFDRHDLGQQTKALQHFRRADIARVNDHVHAA